MPSHDQIIKNRELQILINMFDHVEISYPAINNFQLVNAKPARGGYALDVKTPDFKEFARIYDGASKGVSKEIVKFHDFRECFIASGCLKYTNAEDIESQVATQKCWNPNIKYAPDSNILYHGYLSRSPIREEKILLAPTVFNELNGVVNRKFNQDEINEIKSRVDSQAYLFDEFVGKREKRSRKASFFAINELNKLTYTKVDPIQDSYSKGDIKIVEELEKFKKEANIDITVLTADQAMTDVCKLHNMPYMLLKVPSSGVRVKHCSDGSFRDLVYYMASIFGFIKLNSTIIYSDFKSWDDDVNLKICFSYEDRFKKFKERLNLSRKLVEFKGEIKATNPKWDF